MSNATSAFVSVDLLALATNPNYFNTLSATNISSPAISFLSYHPSFESSVLGPTARAHLVTDLPWEAFHEGGVYDKTTNSMYISSNYQSLQDNVNITILSLDDYSITSSQFPKLYEANGGSSYYPQGSDTSKTPTHQIWCDQGDLEYRSSLVSVNPSTNTSTIVLNNFNGRNFSTLNDVRQHPHTGDLWFTDTWYGYYQNFRPLPTLPTQVYRFEPSTGVVEAVADAFDQPNGLEFSPDYKTLYVTDSGAMHVTMNKTRPATIYAYDIVNDKTLANGRLFAYLDTGVPDGIHADTDGNVWVSRGDGVQVFSKEGTLLGKIFIGETSNNFAFIPNGVLIFANSRLWRVENVKAQGREICKDFGVGCGRNKRVRNVVGL